MNVSTVLALLSVSAAVVAAQTPATVAPAPTPAATAPTTASPSATTAQSAPAATKLRSCWDVSVEHDATYCIQGPICSGSGAQPAGWNCPKKGDVAVADCYKYLASYADASKCVAPVDAECRVIKTGAWGCVWKGTTSSPVTPAPTAPQPNPTPAKTTTTTTPTKAPASTTPPTAPTSTAPTKIPASTPPRASSGSGSDIPAIQIPANDSSAAEDDGETIQFPKTTTGALSTTSLSAVDSGSTGSSTSSGTMIGVIGAIAGIACVVAGAAFYRRRQIQQQEAIDIESAISTPTGSGRVDVSVESPPTTPPIHTSRRFIVTGTI